MDKHEQGVMPELDQLQVDWTIYDVTYDIWHYNIRCQSSLISAWFLHQEIILHDLGIKNSSPSQALNYSIVFRSLDLCLRIL